MTAQPITHLPHYGTSAPLVGVLGPLEFAGEVAPKANMIRKVLALLASQPGAVVLSRDIARELWGDTLAGSWMTTVQTYVLHLRRKFEVPIETRPAGYALSASPFDVDASRFGQYVDRARVRLRDGDLAGAEDTLYAALSLWRGPALVDVVRGPLLETWARTIEKRRRTARTLKREIDLALGRHREVLDELREDWESDRSCEDAAYHLMLALHRSRRRVEALAVYRTVRAVLLEEQGMDPCGDLQRLQQQILSGDPSLELNGETR